MDAIELLESRASVSKLREPAPDDATLAAIVEAALRAPDHGALRPWRVIAIRGEARARLGDAMAQCLRAREPSTPSDVLDRERKKPLRAPLLLAVAATVRESPKAPEIEQVISAGCVAHGILLGLHARGFGAIWRTGDALYDPALARALGVEGARLVALLYAGPPEPPAPVLARPRAADYLCVF